MEEFENVSLDDYIKMKKIEPPNNYLKSSAPEKSKFTRHCGKGSSKMNDLAYADNDYSMDEDLDSSSISTVYARHQRNFEKNCFNRRQQMSVHKRLGNCNSKWQPQGLKRYSNNYDMKLMKFAAQNQVVNDFASPVISALTQMKPICQEVIKSLSKKMLGEINGTAGPAASKDLKYNIEIQKEIFNLQNKPFQYKCPGGTPVSQDGPGIDAKVFPNTTGGTLSKRFT